MAQRFHALLGMTGPMSSLPCVLCNIRHRMFPVVDSLAKLTLAVCSVTPSVTTSSVKPPQIHFCPPRQDTHRPRTSDPTGWPSPAFSLRLDANWLCACPARTSETQPNQNMSAGSPPAIRGDVGPHPSHHKTKIVQKMRFSQIRSNRGCPHMSSRLFITRPCGGVWRHF